MDHLCPECGKPCNCDTDLGQSEAQGYYECIHFDTNDCVAKENGDPRD